MLLCDLRLKLAEWDAPQRIYDDEIRQEVYDRDGGVCQICGCNHSLQVHHVIARGSGGDKRKNNLINLILVCAKCHDRLELKVSVKLRITYFDPDDVEGGLVIEIKTPDEDWIEIDKSYLSFYLVRSRR